MAKTRRYALPALLLIALLTLAGCPAAPASPTPAVATAQATPAAPAKDVTAPDAPAGAPTVTVRVTATVPAAFSQVSFDQVVTGPEEEQQSVKVVIKQGNFRMETESGGEQMIVLANEDQGVGYLWVPAQNSAMPMPFAGLSQEMDPAAGTAALSETARQGKLVGSDTIDGRAADVYEGSYEGEPFKAWVARENGFPLRMEVQSQDGPLTVEYRNLNFGPVDDSQFDLPAGVQIVGAGDPNAGATPAP